MRVGAIVGRVQDCVRRIAEIDTAPHLEASSSFSNHDDLHLHTLALQLFSCSLTPDPS